MGGHDGPPVRGDGLQVHVEGGLTVVLLPPPRASGGGVHSRQETGLDRAVHSGIYILTILLSGTLHNSLQLYIEHEITWDGK